MDINKIISFFDLQRNNRNLGAKAQARDNKWYHSPNFAWFLQIMAIALGVWLSPTLNTFQETNEFVFTPFSTLEAIGYLIIAYLVSATLANLALDMRKPVLPQLPAYTIIGVGWQHSLGSIVTGLSAG